MHTSRLLAALLLLCLTALGSTAQSETRGTMCLTEGTRFLIAYPQVWADSTEGADTLPLSVIISSRFNTVVRIRVPAAKTDIDQRIDKTYQLNADQTIRVPISRSFMMPGSAEDQATESQVIKGVAIEITSQKPISVSTHEAWQGNGERDLHLPVAAWGTTYSAMSFFNDVYGTTNAKHRPGQILVIADRDSTRVTFIPKWNTQGGAACPPVKAGETGTVMMMRGQVFIIKAAIYEPLAKDFTTDLSGTQILANKPVGVISGHTKVAIMRMPSTTIGSATPGRPLNTVRNCVHEVLLPNEMAGTEFVTLPVMYTSKRSPLLARADLGADDMNGDVIRFNALQDSTLLTVRWKLQDVIARRLRLNDSYIESTQIPAVHWVTSKPALCAQYGKSWAYIENNSLGEGAVGQPMMQIVPSTDRWVCYGSFNGQQGHDNFVGIAFYTADSARIRMDGTLLKDLPGTSIATIGPEKYSYVALPVDGGRHIIDSDDESVRWMAWSYGSLDGTSPGYAYGAPVAVDAALMCDDSLVVEDSIACGSITTTITAASPTSSCGAIYMVYADSLMNCTLNKSELFNPGARVVQYSTNVLDPSQPAYGRVRTVSRSGKYIDKVYTFAPPIVGYDPWVLNYGNVRTDSLTCTPLAITNPSATDSLVIPSLSMRSGRTSITITPSTIALGPSESTTVNVCARIPASTSIRDTIVATARCGVAYLSVITVSTDGTYTGVEEERGQPDAMRIASVSPNPGRDVIDVEINTSLPATLELVDMTGSVLSSLATLPMHGAVPIDVHMLASGTYVVRLRAGAAYVVARVVVLP